MSKYLRILLSIKTIFLMIVIHDMPVEYLTFNSVYIGANCWFTRASCSFELGYFRLFCTRLTASQVDLQCAQNTVYNCIYIIILTMDLELGIYTNLHLWAT